MSYSIKDKSTITLTRGDTFKAIVNIFDNEGNPYTPSSGDKVRFAMKRNYDSTAELLILKDIPISTMILHLKPEDTKHLTFGNYVYDIELTKENGDVDTFITKAALILTEEVH